MSRTTRNHADLAVTRHRPRGWSLAGTASVLAAFWCSPARAGTYHISQSRGADSNDGSEASPFATVGACAQIATAGDTCIVHAGIYRETVSPTRSGTEAQPIVFRVADGECATISGAEPVSAPFTKVEGNVWVAPLADAVEQMFSNGTMMWEAQWPNRTPGTLFELPKGVAAQGTGVVTQEGGIQSILVDPSIPDGDWAGGTVFILPGSRWQSDSRPIRAYDRTTHTLTLDTTVPWAEKSIQPIPTNPYYLYGSLLALDAQDEWVYQAGKVYFYSIDDPGARRLEYKKRSYALDVRQSHVQVIGFRVFGAAVRITGNHNTVDSLAIEYPTHLRVFNAYHTMGEVNRIEGDDNVWKNSIIQRSGSAGLVVAGNRNLVENNILRDIVYQATNHAGLDIPDWTASYRENVLVRNTVERSGRSGIFAYGSKAGRILYNRVTDWALLTHDMGGIYAWGTDGEGTEIAFNDVGGTSAFWSNGIYLDDKCKHFVVHHNYVHDSAFFGFCIKGQSDFLHNTTQNVGTPFLVANDFQTGEWPGTNLARVENNLSDGTLLVRVGLLPTVVSDYGYFETPVHATPEWQHIEVPFSAMHQAGWYTQKPFDLAAVKQLAFTPSANGDFEFDIDNITLIGPTPLVFDDFESGGDANALKGYPWGGGSGDGVTGTSGRLTFEIGGPTGNGKHARFAGTMVAGNDSWGLMTESIPDANLTAYTGISFDIRGRMKGYRVLAAGGNGPALGNNDSCSLSTATNATCGLDRGAVITGLTDGFVGAAPDLGAFESGVPKWSAGAERPSDALACGKIADATGTLPPRYVPTWADGGALDGGALDGGALDGGVPGDNLEAGDHDESPAPDGPWTGDAWPSQDGAGPADSVDEGSGNSNGCGCHIERPPSSGPSGGPVLHMLGLGVLALASARSRQAGGRRR